MKQGQYKDSKEILHNSLKIFDQVIGEESLESAAVLQVLGGVYSYGKEYEKASRDGV